MIDYIFYNKAYCNLCLENKTSEKICSDCMERLEFVEGIKELDYGPCIYPLFYNNFVKEAIKRFKYNKCSYLAKVFSEIMEDTLKSMDIYYDYISYIPMFSEDEYDRGYNQSKLLGMQLAKKNGIICLDLVKKTRSTKHQNKLKRLNRLDNLHDAFEIIDQEEIMGKTILLVDDLVTTGSTFNTMSKIIKDKYDVNIICIAIASSESNFQGELIEDDKFFKWLQWSR